LIDWSHLPFAEWFYWYKCKWSSFLYGTTYFMCN